jgi:hypothetical protein
VDPAQVERALRGHARTQNALAAAVTRSGGAPLSPDWSAPSYDLAWHHQGRTYVAEVKSLTPTNEERQLRLGLGQVLRYRQIMRRLLEREVTAVLAVESQPSDTAWAELCAALDVVLCWGPTFDLDLIAPRATSSEDTLPA